MPPALPDVAVVPIVKTLEILRQRLEGCVARESLSSEELAVLGVVEAIAHTGAPRIAYGNEDRGDAVMETEALDDPQRAGLAIAPRKLSSLWMCRN